MPAQPDKWYTVDVLLPGEGDHVWMRLNTDQTLPFNCNFFANFGYFKDNITNQIYPIINTLKWKLFHVFP